MLDDLDAAIGGNRGDQRAFDLRTGGVTSRRARSDSACGRPRESAPSWPARSRSNSAPRLISLATSSGPSVTKHAYGVLDAQTSAGHQGVVNVLLDRVALGLYPGDAALRPVSRAG